MVAAGSILKKVIEIANALLSTFNIERDKDAQNYGVQFMTRIVKLVELLQYFEFHIFRRRPIL